MLYLSICIPTKDRVEYLKKTVQSIIESPVDYQNYEIVISDNSDGNATEEYAESLKLKGINVLYFRNPVKGFYNSIKSLTLGRGLLLKLHNDYSAFADGALSYLVDFSRKYNATKPVVFFSNGTLNLKSSTPLCVDSFDRFIRITTYQNTWSSAFSIWRDELANIDYQPENVDIMFPHTSLLFNLRASKYIIDDKLLINNIPVEKKGGYNIFENFSVLYLNMLNDLLKRDEISFATYHIVKYQLFVHFLVPWFYRTVETDQGYTFDSTRYSQHIRYSYGWLGYLLLRIVCKVVSCGRSLVK